MEFESYISLNYLKMKLVRLFGYDFFCCFILEKVCFFLLMLFYNLEFLE